VNGILIGVESDLPGHVTGTVNGVNGYWARLKVSSSITASPTISLTKLGRSRVQINSDGFFEKFGRVVDLRAFPSVSLSTVDDLVSAAPANGAVQVSANIRIRAKNNQFAGNSTDGVGQLLGLPFGIDTSRPLIMRLGFVPATDAA